MAKGWVRTQRDIFDHPAFPDEPKTEREAFIWLYAKARYEDTAFDIKGRTTVVRRGTLYATNRQLQKAFRWKSVTRVQKFLAKMEHHKMIKLTTAPRTKTLIEIVNYNLYQPPGDEFEALDSGIDPVSASDRAALLKAITEHTNATHRRACPTGTDADMIEAGIWRDALRLSLSEQTKVIQQVMQRRRGEPPKTFRYFTTEMRKYAASLPMTGARHFQTS